MKQAGRRRSQAALTAEARGSTRSDAAAVAAGQTPPRTSPHARRPAPRELASITPSYTALQQQYGQLLVDQRRVTADGRGRSPTRVRCPRRRASRQPVKYGIVGVFLGIIFGIAGALRLRAPHRQGPHPPGRRALLAPAGARDGAPPGSARTEPAGRSRSRNPRRPKAEAYRAARAGVQFLSMRTPMRRILVTGLRPRTIRTSPPPTSRSPSPPPGSRVVLVDADLRGGQLHERFGLTRGNGLTSVLRLSRFTSRLSVHCISNARKPTNGSYGPMRRVGNSSRLNIHGFYPPLIHIRIIFNERT